MMSPETSTSTNATRDYAIAATAAVGVAPATSVTVIRVSSYYNAGDSAPQYSGHLVTLRHAALREILTNLVELMDITDSVIRDLWA
ncbi:hypothetical protein L915_16844 [Phytophthora nicotianae]|uniref:Uncharacterized protein n=1 Tax=Phytophthora nicotianae TaxID=4792 RepID=W2I803_PHYNI|nr:hypothetical protein L915_16844 [Phytophthora nicotianae]ETL30245.1 hypothetical protein L916_16752 [Phytophthora nicotianae]